MTLLNSVDMASFAARGFLKFDGLVPDEINAQFLTETGQPAASEADSPEAHYGEVMANGGVPVIAPGTSLQAAYPSGSALQRLLSLPAVAGIIQSLVGANPVFDHHFLHITFPPAFYRDGAPHAQHTHQDSTIDPRRAFDIQLMYFPHAVGEEMGGTRFIPGSHLRPVSEASIGRYQNILGQQQVVCPAGTLLVMHMGLWHGGGANRSDEVRYMFKIRLCPTARQQRLWDTEDLGEAHWQQHPIFWAPGVVGDPVQKILMTPEPWYEFDTGRLELLNRLRFWRYLLGDASFDADYWLTRIENEYR